MQHISEVLQDSLVTKGITSKPPMSEARKNEIRRRVARLEQLTQEPLVVLVLRDMRDLIDELDRKEGGE